MRDAVLLQSHVPGLPVRRGKVRDVYDLGDTLAVVATDRISAFDWVMPTGIPGKGRVLTEMTKFWLEWLAVPNHMIFTAWEHMPAALQPFKADLDGRTMIVHKARVVPVECVARGYLTGSGWKEYKTSGRVCGLPLRAGYAEAGKLVDPIFTPATKAETGHDENISFAEMAAAVGDDLAAELRAATLDIYRRAAGYAATRGIIVADTKLEWGIRPGDGRAILIDEVLTPDSSRFWPAEDYAPGGSPPSFDKQFLRDWLESTGWDKNSPPPELPPEVVEKTANKYEEALVRLTR